MAFCPNLKNSQVKVDFDKLVGEVGENLAYYYWNQHEGNLENIYKEISEDNKEVLKTKVLKNSASYYENQKSWVYAEDKREEGIIPIKEKDLVESKVDFIQKKLNIPVRYKPEIPELGRVVKEESQIFIELNPSKLERDTPFHEFAHIFIDTVGLNSDIVQKGLKMLRGTPLESTVERDYPDLEGQAFDRELLAEAIGSKVTDIFESRQGRLIDRFQEWIKAFFNRIRNTFGFNPDYIRKLATQSLDKEISVAIVEVQEAQKRDPKVERQERFLKSQEKLANKIIGNLQIKVKIRKKQVLNEKAKIKLKTIENLADKMAKIESWKALAQFTEFAQADSIAIEKRIEALRSGKEEITNVTLRAAQDYLATYKQIDQIIELADASKEFSDQMDSEGITKIMYDVQSRVHRVQARIERLKKEALLQKLKPFYHRAENTFRQKFAKAFRSSMPYDEWGKSNPKSNRAEYEKVVTEHVNKFVAENKENIERQEEQLLLDLMEEAPGDIGIVDMWFTSPRDLNDDLLQLTVQMLDKAEYDQMRAMAEKVKQGQKIWEDFNKVSPSSKMETKYEMFLEDEVIYKEGEIVKTGKKNKAYVQEYFYSLYNSEKAELFNRYYDLKENGTKEEIAAQGKLIRAWNKENSLKIDNQWTPSSKWKNPQYKKIMDYKNSAPAIYNMFKFLIETNEEADNLLPTHSRLKNKLPTIRKSTTERFYSGGLLTTAWQELGDKFKKREDEEDFGEETEDERNLKARLKNTISVLGDEAGKEKQFIPIHFRGELKNEADQSFDLLSMALLNYNMSKNYSNKLDIEADIGAMRDIFAARDVVKRDIRGRMKINAVTKEAMTKDGDVSNSLKALDSIIEDRVFGIKTVGDPKINKALQGLMGITGDLALVGNYLAGVRNVMQGKTINWIESKAGKFLDKGALRKAEALYDKEMLLEGGFVKDLGKRVPSTRTGLMIERFGGLQDWNALNINFADDNRFKALFKKDSLHAINHMGEHYIQGTLMHAVIESTKVLDAEGNQVSLQKAYEKIGGRLAVKDGYTTLEGGKIDQDFEFKVKQKLNKISRALYGNYGKDNQNMAQRTIAGKMATMFRKWMPPGFKERFRDVLYKGDALDRSRHYDITTDTFSNPHYTTFINAVGKDLIKFRWKLIQKNLRELSPEERRAVRRTIYEVGTMIVSAAIAALLKGLADDEDDPAARRTYFHMAYWTRSLYSEMSFYANPSEWLRLLRTPAAPLTTVDRMLRLLYQLPNFTEEYQTGRRKGQLKIAKKAEDVFGVGYRQWSRSVEEATEYMFK